MNMFLTVDTSALSLRVLIEGDQGSKNETVILLVEQRKFQVKFKEEKICLNCADLLTRYITCKRVFNRPMITGSGKISARDSLGSFIFSEDTVPQSQSQSQSYSQVEGIESNANIDFEHSTGSSQSGGVPLTQNKESQSHITPSQEQNGPTKLNEEQNKNLNFNSPLENSFNNMQPSDTNAGINQSYPSSKSDAMMVTNREHFSSEATINSTIPSSTKRYPVLKNARSDINVETCQSQMEPSPSPHPSKYTELNKCTFPLVSNPPISVSSNPALIATSNTSGANYSQPFDVLNSREYVSDPDKISRSFTSTIREEASTPYFQDQPRTLNPTLLRPTPTPTPQPTAHSNFVQNSSLPSNSNSQLQPFRTQCDFKTTPQQSSNDNQIEQHKEASVSQSLQKSREATFPPTNLPHDMNSGNITSFRELLAAPELPTILDTLGPSSGNQRLHGQPDSSEYLSSEKENLQDCSDEELLKMIAAILKDPEFPPLVERLEKLWALKIIGNF
ncbi:hypothetical protein K7432_010315 [Basidiobolus ranarum]|uniref:Uncharacterized protein n=1 Tax=Basidiobolus ranarum TaxID=34480 RepID=A0ABR2VVM2_9FUNG